MGEQQRYLTDSEGGWHMLKYIGKRLALGIVTLFALMTITFFLMHMIPGSPA